MISGANNQVPFSVDTTTIQDIGGLEAVHQVNNLLTFDAVDELLGGSYDR